jgi:hypothetical protein
VSNVTDKFSNYFRLYRQKVYTCAETVLAVGVVF